MAVKKSRKYEVDGNNYAFDFVSDKLAGIKKVVNGVLNPIPPKGSEFASVSSSDEALDAYRIAKYGSNKTGAADETAVEKLSDEELQDYYDKEVKKGVNEQFIENFAEPALAFTEPRDTGGQYNRGNSSYRSNYKGILGDRGNVYAYPLDIDLDQDHFKITRYNYVRPDINQSKPRRKQTSLYGLRSHNVAGDSVIGSKIAGSIILPMPKPTDVNGAEWGKSELTITGLAALGVARAASLGGRLTGKSAEQRFEDRRAKMAAGRPGDVDITGRGIRLGQAITAQTLANMASNMAGTEIDTDTFLARTGGKVLNPNAEILFQGPVIRDFAFSFQMVARSEEEGREIRKIIKFLKMGLAPKFNNTVFLENPDVFTLQYKNGSQDNDFIKNVNQFSPGGLALTTMNVDYAPSGYWSAYRDSQPVSVKMDLNFTELRPLYQQDHEETPEDSVGY